MLKNLKAEIRHFAEQPHDFRILVLTNMIYALVLPVIDIFVAAYVMRNSNDPTKVVIYQLTIYTGIPLTFLINGFLLNRFSIKTLYSAGMMLSGVSMMVMMSLTTLDLTGIAVAGMIMGMSFGFYWANRDYLALSITNDHNRNYYYGLETFFYTIIAVVIPICIGWFIELVGNKQSVNVAYRIITAIVFVVTIAASVVCFRGNFSNPKQQRFIFFKFDPYWSKLLLLAALKGLAQGYLVTAPAMLIMLLLGKEGALGTAQSVGAIIAAILMYIIGRMAKPAHRLYIFAAGLVFFAIAAIFNGALFNATGVIIFMMFLLLAKPLLDLAYFPIQFNVIDILSKKERRNEFAYILNHEVGLYAGRFLGAATFIFLAYYFSREAALRYAIVIIALLQLLSLIVARSIIRQGKEMITELNEKNSQHGKIETDSHPAMPGVDSL
ncbi:MFS transporter, YQGE family, putative transporter [Chitinophaga terrae (ex Kim and Jung 2007)]|uniref:MFS transporter, YQGE family, putative transporter n=1 Tax=Chitinophaga terrae (ex Kim and Jung 2007) TaxID=408074 RepID=A0A1H4FN46_9BACT|nr:MFS transporter [Chitinophaga terrae (ex Kim and Jung 2007)]GEP89037.1 MFS transporter [Chitinophaga terrae (ex Kim and Jung 2007)]SEA98128.1 MFS transporter, YQGE family, putative transporter [Chitinophaga terrae (ex Kim and Jung 2007)]